MADLTSDDGGLRELALFAGAGGGILGGHLLGWRTVCAVEWEPYAASVLAQRQNDGLLPPFPIWDDVRTFDGRPWRGLVDVVSGGFPCQDISVAGKGAGIDGARSGMWAHMARIVDEVRPRFVFVENSPLLVGRGLDRVLADLARLGFDARWCVMGATAADLPHGRERFWMVAYPSEIRREPAKHDAKERRHNKARHARQGSQGAKRWPHRFDGTFPTHHLHDWEIPESGSVRGIDGLAEWMDRVSAVGNGQVPTVAQRAVELLMPEACNTHNAKLNGGP